MKWAIYNQVHSAGFLGFWFISFWKLENQWKPVETWKLFCLFTDDYSHPPANVTSKIESSVKTSWANIFT